jgi:hypothetical protein
MTSEERKRMYELCTLIQDERDHDNFLELVRELNGLFDRKEHRLDEAEG